MKIKPSTYQMFKRRTSNALLCSSVKLENYVRPIVTFTISKQTSGNFLDWNLVTPR